MRKSKRKSKTEFTPLFRKWAEGKYKSKVLNMLWKPMGDTTIFNNLNHMEITKLRDRQGKGNFRAFIHVNEH